MLLPGTGEATGLCGPWEGDKLSTDPGDDPIAVPVPTPDGSEILMRVHLEGARLEGDIDTAGLNGVLLGGGIPPDELAAVLRSSIGSEPHLLAMTDGCPEYGNTIEGCETLVPGEGECTADGYVSEVEFRCHSIIHQVLEPDVPPAHPGGTPRVSLGIALDALPATIVPIVP